MKVLLIQCPCSFGVEAPPLGLGYLSAFLKKHSYDVSAMDLSIKLYHQVADEHKIYWSGVKGYAWYLIDVFQTLPFLNNEVYDRYTDEILSMGRDVIGFSLQNTSVLFTREIIKRLKQRDTSKTIVLGGPNCYNYFSSGTNFKLHHDLQEFADIVVIGEGEETLLQVVRSLESGGRLDRIKGIARPGAKGWVFNGFAPPVRHLDELPFPDFGAFDLAAYTDHETLPIITSRGCVMKCVFCTDTFFWNRYRCRSAKNIFLEMTDSKRKYGNTFFGFNDSLINGNLDNFLKLCDMLITNRTCIGWGGNCRIDKRLTPETLNKFKAAGCAYLSVGIESGSNRILKLMRKGFTVEEAERFLRACKAVGIDMVVNWIVGFPTETEHDFQATLDFIKQNKEYIKVNTSSTLTINQFSYLEQHRSEFGVVLDGPHLGLWRSRDGTNTIDQRNARLKRLEELSEKIHRDFHAMRQVNPDSKP